MPRLKKGEPRYKEGKIERELTDSEFIQILQKAHQYREERKAKHGHHWFKDVNIPGLIAMLYYTGLRITELVGDVPHKYHTKRQGWKKSEIIDGILKEDIQLKGRFIRIQADEVRKHGHRESPLWLPIDKPGVEDIVETWNATKKGKRLFPISRSYAWKFVKEVTGKLYPHFFRLNRATKFAEHPKTSIKDLKDWFGWVDARTIEKYLAKGGRATKDMAQRI